MRRLLHPVSPPPAGTWQRRELIAATGLLVLGMIALSVPASSLTVLAGSIHDVEGQPVVGTLAFLLGGACLLGALWAAVRALTGTRSERLGMIVLALIVTAQFGGVYRLVLQLAALHHFYLSSNHLSAAASYWGITITTIATAAFVLPLVLAVGNALPRTHGPALYKRAVLALCRQRHYLLFPLLASAAIIGVCAVMPSSLRANLGYSSPGIKGGRVVFPINIVDTTVWQSFARLLFLPLLVGMWEGMESARACFTISTRKRIGERARRALDYRVLVAVAAAGAIAFGFAAAAPLAIPAGIVLASAVVLAGAGAMPRLVAVTTLRDGARWGFSEDWRSAAPIGRVLLVLAAPALLPLCVDLWQGIEGPFRLPVDAGSYIYFWRGFGIDQVPSVTLSGVFGHEIGRIALYSVTLTALALIGALLARDAKDLKKAMRLLVPIAVIAGAMVPIVSAADHPIVVILVGAGALPVFLLLDASPERDDTIAAFVLSLVLLTGWAYAVWNFEWLPPFAVLSATIVWRFLIAPGDLNELDADTRFRRVAGFAALGLLGVGMLVLSHDGQAGVLPSDRLATITDHVAVALVAPIWLVHYVVQHLAHQQDGP